MLSHIRAQFHLWRDNYPKHLFIVAGPKSGSTILWKRLSSCRYVSAMPLDEGQKYFGKDGPVGYENPRWVESNIMADNSRYNWNRIKEIWDAAWDKKINPKRVFLEKSPPNIVRWPLLKEQFENVYFLVLVRNPWSHVISLADLWGEDYERRAKDVRYFWRQQKKLLSTVPHSCYINYEDICDRPRKVRRVIKKLLPELYDIPITKLKNKNFSRNILTCNEQDKINDIFQSEESLYCWTFTR